MEEMPFTIPEGNDFSHHQKNVVLSREKITQLNQEGFRFKNETIKMIDECGNALERIPPGMRGIAIGTGQNSQDFHLRGWETIDIDPSVKATYTADANNLTEVVQGKKFDFVLSEFVTLNAVAGTPVARVDRDYLEPALGHERLLRQANAVLKDKGRLIIQTVDFGDESSDLPKSESFAVLMRKHGFAPVLEVKTLKDFTDQERRNEGTIVSWYAEKIAELPTPKTI